LAVTTRKKADALLKDAIDAFRRGHNWPPTPSAVKLQTELEPEWRRLCWPQPIRMQMESDDEQIRTNPEIEASSNQVSVNAGDGCD
jgi:hypothetical protein